MFRPASSTRVLRPFSVSSFAAQPPVMPEPITIASKMFCSLTGARCLLHGSSFDTTLVLAGDNFEMQFVRGSCFRGVVGRECQSPKHGIETRIVGISAHTGRPARGCLRLLHHLFTKRRQNVCLLQRRAIHEILTEETLRSRVDVAQAVEKTLAVEFVAPLR